MRYSIFFLAASTIGFFAAVLLAGCDAGSTFAATSQADSVPTLTFNSDWTIAASGALVGGASAKVHYDIARLPQCRTLYHGGPAWGLTANWAADGGFARSVPVVQYLGGVNQPVDAAISIPFGADLALWFHNSDESGCSAWDSNYGRDFHFAITPPPEPVLRFYSNWTTSGSARAGSDFLVDYDPIRSPTCRATYNEFQAWDITAHARFSDGSTQDQSVTQPVGTIRYAAPGRFHAPAGASFVELWFENTDTSGCHAWDSNYGQNYRFSL
jgi:hypothetical protein